MDEFTELKPSNIKFKISESSHALLSSPSIEKNYLLSSPCSSKAIEDSEVLESGVRRSVPANNNKKSNSSSIIIRVKQNHLKTILKNIERVESIFGVKFMSLDTCSSTDADEGCRNLLFYSVNPVNGDIAELKKKLQVSWKLRAVIMRSLYPFQPAFPFPLPLPCY